MDAPKCKKGRSSRPLIELPCVAYYWQLSIFLSAAEMPESEKT